MSSWQRQAQCKIGAAAELERELKRKLFEYFAFRLALPRLHVRFEKSKERPCRC